MQSAVIVFDCDGVLLDSNRMKGDAFAAALSDFPADTVEAFLDYQRRNFGRSRYQLFNDFYEMFLKQEVDEAGKSAMLTAFGNHCSKTYRTVPMTEGALDAVSCLAEKFPLAVASGSDQQELRDVFRHRELDRYFMGIYGSPTPKSEILKSIAQDREILCMIGDAHADYQAACAVGARFVYVKKYSLVADQMMPLSEEAGFPVIDTLEFLPDIIQSIGAEPCPR